MGIFLLWIILCFVIGAIGSSRVIGFTGAFFSSLFFSPIIGGILTFCSKDKANESYKEQMLKAVKEQKTTSVSDEILKLKDLYDKGILTQEQFESAKSKLV